MLQRLDSTDTFKNGSSFHTNRASPAPLETDVDSFRSPSSRWEDAPWRPRDQPPRVTGSVGGGGPANTSHRVGPEPPLALLTEPDPDPEPATSGGVDGHRPSHGDDPPALPGAGPGHGHQASLPQAFPGTRMEGNGAQDACPPQQPAPLTQFRWEPVPRRTRPAAPHL